MRVRRVYKQVVVLGYRSFKSFKVGDIKLRVLFIRI